MYTVYERMHGDVPANNTVCMYTVYTSNHMALAHPSDGGKLPHMLDSSYDLRLFVSCEVHDFV